MRRHLARAGAGLGMATFVAFTIGCMNLSFGGRTQVVSPPTEHAVDGLQRGKSFAGAAQELTVYYPAPYASPPNLEFEDEQAKRSIQIVEQRADCFRVKNLHGATELTWKARGVLASSSAKTPTTNGVVQTGSTTPTP